MISFKVSISKLALQTAVILGLVASTTYAQPSRSPEWIRQSEITLTLDPGAGLLETSESNTPLADQRTLEATVMAVNLLRTIEANGGWGIFPEGPTLREGVSHPLVAKLRERLWKSGDLNSAGGEMEIFDSFVTDAVKRFQARHGLVPDGIVSSSTRSALNVPAGKRAEQLALNIPRLQELAKKTKNQDRFVSVNIPATNLEGVEDHLVAVRHEAIAGKNDRQSPIISVSIREIIFNPTWTVPRSIIEKDLIPRIKEDPDFLVKNRIHIFNGRNQELNARDLDWSSPEVLDLRLKQEAFSGNSMGTAKIFMPNIHSVYMHDTPSLTLFGGQNRFLSSGCVRVQQIHDLIAWLLSPQGWSRETVREAVLSTETIEEKLKSPVPVHWVYITAWASDNGTINFRNDVYGLDEEEGDQLASSSSR